MPAAWQDQNYTGRTPAPYGLSSLVNDICLRAGIPPSRFNSSMLLADVDGFIVTNKHPAFSHIRTLGDNFFFDPVNKDGKLHFVPRGGEPVATIDPDDVLDDVDEDEELQRKDNLSIPRVLNFSYFDLSGGLQPDLQVSDRSLDTRSVGELGLDSPLIYRANDSKRITVMSHKVLVEEQRGEYRIKLPDSYLYLTAADVVMYRNERLRIFEIEVNDGYQSLRLTHDRGSAYISNETGQEPLAGSPVKSINPGVTYFEPIDSHILQTQDDELGYYLAATGKKHAWTGAIIELSTDGGASYKEISVAGTSAVIGELNQSLPAHSADFPDQNSTLTVAIHTYGAELEAATLEEMLNRKNRALVGDEIVSFGNVNEISPGLWELSYLLRGRLGTDAVSHSAGERFVLLDREDLLFIPVEPYDIGQSYTFRATTLNGESESSRSITFTGKSQIERRPAYLNVVRDGNDLTISWQGVARMGGRTQLYMGKYFDGYRVEVDGQVINTTNTSVQVTVSAGSHTVSVKQVNKLTGEGPAIEVQA